MPTLRSRGIRRADSRSILAIDFEASCLPIHGRSYPIEVGIADERGAVRSWLIRPVAQWRDWDWTEEAQRLHGITREQLFDQGQPVEKVAHELCVAIHGYRVIANSYLDSAWMRTLMEGARHSARPMVEHIEALVDQWRLSDDAVRACAAAVERWRLPRHRAGDDARWLGALIGLLRAESAGGRSPKGCDRDHFFICECE